MPVLGSLAKRRKDTAPEIAQTLQKARLAMEALLEEVERIQGSCIDEVRGVLQGYEGTASRNYWAAVSVVFPPEFSFQ